MRLYPVLIAFGIIAALFGIAFLAASTSQMATTTFTLQPGTNYCTYHAISTVGGGTVTITFTASPGTVAQYVMTAAQETAFFGGAGLAYIGTDTAASDTFTTSLPTGGTYYVVSCHGTGYESTLQVGTHTMTVNGLIPGPFYAAVGAFVLACILIAVGLWLRSRPKPSAPAYATPPPYTGYPPYPGTGWGGPSQAAVRPPATAPYPVAPAAFGTVVVSVENATAADTMVQVLVNNAPMASLAVGAGKTERVTLHPPLGDPYGSVLRVEAVAADGRRASQDVTATAHAGTSVSMRLS